MKTTIEITCQVQETKTALFKLDAVVKFFQDGKFTFGQTLRGVPAIYFTPAAVDGEEPPKRIFLSWEDPAYGEDGGPETYPKVRGYERFSSPPVRKYADIQEVYDKCPSFHYRSNVRELCVFEGLTTKGREFFDKLLESLWDEYYRRISEAEKGVNIGNTAINIAKGA